MKRVALIFFLGAAAGSLQAQVPLSFSDRLTSATGIAGDYLGRNLDAENGVAAVGAPMLTAGFHGRVHVWRNQSGTWTEAQNVAASDAQPADTFGETVALGDGALLVGASGHDDHTGSTGAAYFFQDPGTGFAETQKLVPTDGATYSLFGESVALDGDTALVGARLTPGAAGNVGAAYLFSFDGTSWVETQKLVPSDPQVGQGFGSRVALQGDVAVVASQTDPTLGQFAGAVYVFRYDGVSFVEEQKLYAGNGSHDDLFGTSIALDGDTILVGALKADRSGCVHVYRFQSSTWVEEALLIAADVVPGSAFGYSVDLDQGIALIGRPETYNSTVGVAHMFRDTGAGWVESVKLEGDGNDTLGGWDVALDGTSALVGATNKSQVPGAVYCFDLPDLGLGTNLDIIHPGDLLTLSACGGQPHSPAYLVLGGVQGQPLWLNLFFAQLDATGHQSITVKIKKSFGVQADFFWVGIPTTGQIGISSTVSIDFQ